ncbi:MAG: DNA mismatch repair endonuclease MutL [Spirochaetales bacterium]|nr:DNA mismatch repair endonuclease MutL [Spirochaetales bacterium]
MNNNDKIKGPEFARIRVLVDSVARRIAAGEVIDRPYSVVRELLDNAIDAGSSKIRLDIKQGGIESITCTDDGTGMVAEDLKLAILPHATSKIREFDDLYNLSTLGFRGEALSSIAACSRLEILSRERQSDRAYRITVHGGRIIEQTDDHGAPGTRIHVEDLFYSLPGRKKFLKTPGAEGNLSYSAFLEKAMPFPEIEFRYFNNDKMKMFLPKGDIKERVCAAYPRILNSSLVNSWESDEGPYNFKIAGATPSLYRKDRRYIQIYVNKRRINDYSLTQAVEYGYSEYLPGGCFPLAFVFITIPPDIVDFNIHPSKKEVRFRDSHTLHRSLVAAVKNGLAAYARGAAESSAFIKDRPLSFSGSDFNRSKFSPQTPFPNNTGTTGQGTNFNKREIPSYQNISSGSSSYAAERVSPSDLRKTLAPRPFPIENENNQEPPYDKYAGKPHEEINDRNLPLRYMGQIMNLFLVVERGNSLFLIDQHAAHERILYNKFLSDPGGKQELLVPMLFEFDQERELLLSENQQKLDEAGFTVEKIEAGRWQLLSMPSRYSGMEDEISDFFTDPKGDFSLLEKKLNHSTSCRKAVKDGDLLDDLTAIKLAEEAFRLPQPRCPHGRPVWFELTREDLYRLVGRSF